jgi:hypothetical protein
MNIRGMVIKTVHSVVFIFTTKCLAFRLFTTSCDIQSPAKHLVSSRVWIYPGRPPRPPLFKSGSTIFWDIKSLIKETGLSGA